MDVVFFPKTQIPYNVRWSSYMVTGPNMAVTHIMMCARCNAGHTLAFRWIDTKAMLRAHAYVTPRSGHDARILLSYEDSMFTAALMCDLESPH